MKRLNWLRNFGLTASVAAATLPAVMMSTSCSVTGYFVDVFDFKKIMKEEGTAKSIERYSTTFNNLLYGSKSNHNGNYILFIGSNTSDSVVNWFAPVANFRDRDQWYGDEYFSNTPFYKALVKVTTDEQITKEGIKDCAFYNFIDFFDWKFYDKKGHEIFISKDGQKEEWIVKPFDKWTQGIIDQTKLYNKNKEGHNYDWDSSSVSTSEYIRQDASAVAYREMMKRALALYPKNDKRKESFVTDDNSDAPKMCVFKDGSIVSIENMPSGLSQSGIDAFVKVVVDNYKVVKDEKKS